MFVVGRVTKKVVLPARRYSNILLTSLLQLEGDTYGWLQVLRATKNRFGPTMGAWMVANPSEALLAERQVTDGSVVPLYPGRYRPLLVEVRAFGEIRL